MIPSVLNGFKYNDAGQLVIIFSRATLTNSVAEPKYAKLDKLVLSTLIIVLILLFSNVLTLLSSNLRVSSE